jgi:hypothetical protein
MVFNPNQVPTKIAGAMTLQERLVKTIGFRQFQSVPDDFAYDHAPASSTEVCCGAACPPVFCHLLNPGVHTGALEAFLFGRFPFAEQNARMSCALVERRARDGGGVRVGIYLVPDIVSGARAGFSSHDY